MLRRIKWAITAVVLFAATSSAAMAYAVDYYLPWTQGKAFQCTQGNNETFAGASHLPSDVWNRYAWDFGLPFGETVRASAAGTVIGLRRDAADFVPNPTISTPVNYVLVAHSDGTRTGYYHLKYNSLPSDIQLNSSIHQGQVLGGAGCSGYSFGVHLHFSRYDSSGHSIALTFADAGVPVHDASYTSGNLEGGAPPPPPPITATLQNPSFEEWSGDACANWAFAGNGEGGKSRVTTPARSGSAYGLTCPTGEPGKENDVRQTVLVEPGKSYTLSAWAMTDRNPDSVHTYLEFTDQAGNVLSAPGTSGDQWGVNSATFSRMLLTATAPANAARVNVVLLLNGGTYLGPGGGSALGSVIFDDVGLSSANLALQNPSFEEWSGDACANWAFAGNGEGGKSRVTTPARSGSAYGLTCPTGEPGKENDVRQTVLVEPGKSYTLSAWAMTDRNPDSVHTYLEFTDQAGNVLSAPGTSGDQWGVNSATFSRMLLTATAPANAARVNVVLLLNGGTYLGPGGGSALGSVIFDDVALSPTTTVRNVYRFFNKKNGSHFYTASESEKNSVVANLSAIYSLDGPAYRVGSALTTPLYRFYNKKNGSHFYTASELEKDNVLANLSATYQLDGPAYSVSSTQIAGTVPVYRFYNRRNGSHFYTASETEKNSVQTNLSAIYQLDGAAFYVTP